MMTKNDTERMAVIETKVENIQGSMNNLITNHLPHIHDELSDVRLEVNGLKKWIIGLLVSVNLVLITSYITLWVKK